MRRVVSSLVALCCSCAIAHESTPAYVEIEELSPTSYRIFFKQPALSQNRLQLRFDHSCVRSEIEQYVSLDAVTRKYTLTCHSSLDGTELIVDGLRRSLTDLLVRVIRGEEEAILVVKPSSPSLVFDFAAQPGTFAYFRIGVEHLIYGWDHLAFLLCLILLLRPTLELLKIVTAFTVAHSVTLSLAALSLIAVPVAVIEILIAVSIFIAAIEAARSHNAEISLKRTWYFVLVFGLLHGAGFASALAQIGLPQDRELPALFLFNIGIEFGQLLILAIALLAGSFGEIALQRLPGWFKRLPAVFAGGFAVYWVLSRTLALLGL